MLTKFDQNRQVNAVKSRTRESLLNCQSKESKKTAFCLMLTQHNAKNRLDIKKVHKIDLI